MMYDTPHPDFSRVFFWDQSLLRELFASFYQLWQIQSNGDVRLIKSVYMWPERAVLTKALD